LNGTGKAVSDMATCKDCIHKKVCDNLISHGLPWKDGKYPAEDFCDLFKNTADVAPKSEVECLLGEIEKTIRAALILVDFSYKHSIKEKQCKKECYEDFLGYVDELKKKYTEENK
jgi:hypothetical protein